MAIARLEALYEFELLGRKLDELIEQFSETKSLRTAAAHMLGAQERLGKAYDALVPEAEERRQVAKLIEAEERTRAGLDALGIDPEWQERVKLVSEAKVLEDAMEEMEDDDPVRVGLQAYLNRICERMTEIEEKLLPGEEVLR